MMRCVVPRLNRICCIIFWLISLGSTNYTLAEQGGPLRLRRFLQASLRTGSLEFDQDARYTAAEVNLNSDGVPEIIVYAVGRGFCGSGGCTMIILAKEGRGFRIISGVSIVRLPIRLLERRTNGWHDLSVRVGGGGISVPYEAELKFGAGGYPSNPTVEPVSRTEGDRAGPVIISVGSDERYLFRENSSR